MAISDDTMKVIASELLPKLYSLEMIDIKAHSGNQKHLFKEMNLFLEGLPRHADPFYLMKLKFNKMNMNKEIPTILKIIERCY